jgi:hypothetical protein
MGCHELPGTGILNGNLNSHGYIDILNNCAIPSAHRLGYGDEFWYQDDGAQCHRAKIVKEWHSQNSIRGLGELATTVLNPIENLWHDIKTKLRNKHHGNLRELSVNVCDLWNELTVNRCRTLVKSMPRRIQAVLAAIGGHTKY